MQIHQLQRKNKLMKSRQVGRGGKRGKTSGRGTKGQKSRSGRKMRPEIRDVIKKIPKLRGRGKNIFTSVQEKPAVVNLNVIEKNFNSGDVVSRITLMEKGFVKKSGGILPKVKILGTGVLTKKLIVKECSLSASARTQILKAGGSIE